MVILSRLVKESALFKDDIKKLSKNLHLQLLIMRQEKMCDTAVLAAKSVNYVGAGTIEFLYDPLTDNFYFMEIILEFKSSIL